MKDEFLQNGFVVILNGIEEAFLQRMETALAGFNPTAMERGDVHLVGPGLVSSMHNLMKYALFYAEGFQPLKELAATFWDEPMGDTVFNASYFAKPALYGLATKEHQDHAYFHLQPDHAVTCWVGLDDSDMANGGLFYYEGSQRLGFLPHAPIGNKGASQALALSYEDSVTLADYPVRFLTLKRGDVVMHSPLVVHGSLSNHSTRPRRAINFSFASMKCQRDEASYQLYREQLDTFLVSA